MCFRHRLNILICCLIAVMLCGCSTGTDKNTLTISTEATIIAVEPLMQFPHYPTGCESVTAVMALHYYGIDISVDEFIDEHLVCDSTFYEIDGIKYGPNPYAEFVGDPRSANSYGCMAPVIHQGLISCLPSEWEAINTTGSSLAELCDKYIDQDIPVIVWATMDMRPVTSGNSWHFENGQYYVWPAGEHCLLLVGYDERSYYFNDPMYGKVVSYHKNLVEQRYAALGKQSLVIINIKPR